MSNLTVRIPDNLIHNIEELSKKLQITKGEYVRRAIEYMNSKILKEEKRDRMLRVSRLVREESMIINKEFDDIEYE